MTLSKMPSPYSGWWQQNKGMVYLSVAALALTILAAVLFGGCANPIAAARNSVATAASVERDMVNQFAAWDSAHQAALIGEANSKPEAENALASYRADRGKVVVAFQSLWAATIATETATNLAEAGLKNKSDLIGLVAALMKTLGDLTETLKVLGLPIPGGV